MDTKTLRVTVIIVTLNRPDCVQRCLDCLRGQTRRPEQILVVDASADEQTKRITADFVEVDYLRTDAGYGHMTQSRNLGITGATGEIVAFLDDDAFAEPTWLEAILVAYDSDSSVAGVGGRALNNQPNEETTGLDAIGKLLPNGTLTGNFAANPAHLHSVDHIIGCNMTFRRSVLLEIGGFRGAYAGTEVREETDVCLRIRRLGYLLFFQPAAVVEHLGAAQSRGQRFDLRYAYFAERNHVILLLWNFGVFSRLVWRYRHGIFGRIASEFGKRSFAGATVRGMAMLAGITVGTVVGIGLLLRYGQNARYRSPENQMLQEAMTR